MDTLSSTLSDPVIAAVLVFIALVGIFSLGALASGDK